MAIPQLILGSNTGIGRARKREKVIHGGRVDARFSGLLLLAEFSPPFPKLYRMNRCFFCAAFLRRRSLAADAKAARFPETVSSYTIGI
jgi:hypothetical protein